MFYAPIGSVITDGILVTCHLCGRSLRSVTAHLRAHGWTKDAYCEAFGLERSQSLEGQETRKRRAAAFTPRLLFDPAVRAGSANGRKRAQTGELTQDAARAAAGRTATGRPVPEQRRAKAAAARACLPPETITRVNRDRASRELARIAATVAKQSGYPDLRAYVLARARAGLSLAAISREAGLHKDWLTRHLADLDSAAAAEVQQLRAGRWDTGWLPAITELGFTDVAGYLHERHVIQHHSVNAIAAEAGLSNHAVKAALLRHGMAVSAHAAKRNAAQLRSDDLASRLGYSSTERYIAQRRKAGWTWQAISAESGQPPTWLRRRAAATDARNDH
ncbi:MAG TPA: MucR family transcriptional regulator [Streptosporangiaceae bacterium]